MNNYSITLKVPSPPKHLTPAARKMWRSFADELGLIDDPRLSLLTAAIEHWQRSESAKVEIDRTGLSSIGANGQVICNPLLRIEHQSRQAFEVAINRLRRTTEKQQSVGRPGNRFGI
jgi:phage terminase small subunit